MTTPRSPRITADPGSVSMAAVIRAAAGPAPLFCLTGRALGDLARELGGMDTALRHLADVAESIGKPVAVNMPTVPTRRPRRSCRRRAGARSA